MQVNPCSRGYFLPAIGAALINGAGIAAAQTTVQLSSFNLSPKSIADLTERATHLAAAYGSQAGVPCGSGGNATHFDSLTAAATGQTAGTDFCAGLTGATLTSCMSAWEPTAPGAFPRCPETQAANAGQWGVCASFALSCPITATYYDDSNPRFMDWWTIFYWAWWITWAPFVGFFVAIISRNTHAGARTQDAPR